MDYKRAADVLKHFCKEVTHEHLDLSMEEAFRLAAGAPTRASTRTVDAVVFHFERGKVYLYETVEGYRLGKPHRSRCKCFVVAAGDTLAQRREKWTVRDALTLLLGGDRGDVAGRTQFSCFVEMHSRANRLVARFGATYPGGNTSWQTERPEAVALGLAYLRGEAPVQAVLDWLAESADEKRPWYPVDSKSYRERFAEACEASLPVAEVSAPPEPVPEPPPPTGRSYKVGCKTSSDSAWAYNGLRFPTREGAEAYGRDLWSRWTALEEWEVHPSDDAPNRE